jgi:tripeptidyl-peptidase-1
MTHEEILAMIAPAEESGDLVMQWLESELSGIGAKMSQTGDYITVEASVKEIEQLLDAEYSVFGISATLRDIQPSYIYSKIRKQRKDSAHPLLQSPNDPQGSC